MKILSIQSYNPQSKINSKQNKNVSFSGVLTEADTLSTKIGTSYRFIKMALQTRAAYNPQRVLSTGKLSDYEVEKFRELYDFTSSIIKHFTPNERGTRIKKLFSEDNRSYRIESGPVGQIEGGASLAEYLPDASDIKNCTSCKILCKDLELNDNFYRVVFDESGFPRIVTYTTEDGNIKYAFAPKKD